MAVQRDPATRPALSVVVTIVDGGQTLRECLQRLLAQDGAPDIEVIVPVDHATRAEAAMRGFSHCPVHRLRRAV